MNDQDEKKNNQEEILPKLNEEKPIISPEEIKAEAKAEQPIEKAENSAERSAPQLEEPVKSDLPKPSNDTNSNPIPRTSRRKTVQRAPVQSNMQPRQETAAQETLEEILSPGEIEAMAGAPVQSNMQPRQETAAQETLEEILSPGEIEAMAGAPPLIEGLVDPKKQKTEQVPANQETAPVKPSEDSNIDKFFEPVPGFKPPIQPDQEQEPESRRRRSRRDEDDDWLPYMGTLSRLRGGGSVFQVETAAGPEAYVLRRTASGRTKMIRVSQKNIERLAPQMMGSETVLAKRGRFGWELQRQAQGAEPGGLGDLKDKIREVLQPFLPLLEKLLTALQPKEQQMAKEQRPAENQQANIRIGERAGVQLAQNEGVVTVRLQPGTRFRIDENTETIEIVS